MIITLLLILIVVGFVLFEMSSYYKMNFLFLIFASLLFIFVGITILAEGIDIQNSMTMTEISSTVTNLTYTYTNYGSGLIRGFGLIFIGLGLYTMINSAFYFLSKQEEKE
jgi:hypothetical protein